jgi:tyrosyl-tRNA synthetase
MTGFKSDFMQIVHERGMVHQCSDLARLDELLSTGARTAYIGFDCTADSLHVGHLLQIMLLRWWQKCGHKPIALMGGGTTKVGDPSGRDETRQLLTTEQINANMAKIKESEQRRLARYPPLHPAAARRRSALLGQPHADDGFGEAAP